MGGETQSKEKTVELSKEDEMQKKVTIKTDRSLQAEQGLTVADEVYGVLKRNGIKIKGIELIVRTSKVPDVTEDSLREIVFRKYIIFLPFSFLPKQELKIEVSWNSLDIPDLIVEERTVFGEGTFFKVSLPLSVPPDIRSFEELKAFGIVKAIQICQEAACKSVIFTLKTSEGFKLSRIFHPNKDFDIIYPSKPEIEKMINFDG